MDTQTDIGEVETVPEAHGSVVPAGPPAAEKDPTRWRLRLVYLGAIVVLAVGTTVAIMSHNQLERTETHLAAIKSDLHRTLGRLVVARRELAKTTDQSEAAKVPLDAESTALAADQKQLATAQANIYSNGVSIGNLDTCLSGVQKSLNLISLGNQAGAATALGDVSISCQSADPSGV